MRAVVENFQSIEKLSLDIEGFTAITGDSNIGKSALVRAIRFALTNATGTYFVRHTPQCGKTKTRKCKCYTSVHLTQEGFDLLWEKGDLKSRYVVNGVTYDKPGKGNLEFLNDLGFMPTKIGSEPILLQSAPQFKPIFMVDQSGPVIAESISDVSKLQRVNQASKAVDKERRDTVAAHKQTEKTLSDTKLSLLAFANLAAAETQVARMRQVELNVDVKTRQLEALSQFAARGKAVTTAKKSLEGVLDQLVSEDPTVVVHESWVTARSYLDRALALKGAMAPLAKVDSVLVPDPSGYSARVEKRDLLGRYLSRVASLKTSIQKVLAQEIPVPSGDLTQPESRLADVRAMESYQRRLARVTRDEVALSGEYAAAEEEALEIEKELSELPKMCLECRRPFHEGDHS